LLEHPNKMSLVFGSRGRGQPLHLRRDFSPVIVSIPIKGNGDRYIAMQNTTKVLSVRSDIAMDVKPLCRILIIWKTPNPTVLNQGPYSSIKVCLYISTDRNRTSTTKLNNREN
jgi:hypothetical protein